MKPLSLGSIALVLVSSVAHAQDDSSQPQPQAPPQPQTMTTTTPAQTLPPPQPQALSEPVASRKDIGGHLGFALPIATLGGRKSVAIGSDFVTVGLTPGVTVHLDDEWAVDFEFIAFNELKNVPAFTTLVVDPGIIRKFDGFVLGLRAAVQVGAPTNTALVPIFVLPFKVGKRAVWFAEMDVPVFLRDGGDKALLTATFLFQSGFGF